jgi:hypothetical protein
VILTVVDGWEIRDFSVDDPRHCYFATHGCSHLQLWHGGASFSVLTPSRLTMGLYEAFPIAGWKHREADWHRLAARVLADAGLRVPSAVTIRSFERWFVRRVELVATTLRAHPMR